MKLTRIKLNGFKSIDSQNGQDISLGDVNILLGANGSGKSNLVSFFSMLNFMTTGALTKYVAKYGVSRLLYFGPKVTESISFVLEFDDEVAQDIYEMRLSHGLPDRLFVSGEKINYKKKDYDHPQEYFLTSGSDEAGLGDDSRQTSKVVHALLKGIRTYQFHDTSETSRIRDRSYKEDANYLRSDAGNLAAMIRSVSTSTQVLVATQSTRLVDEFDPEDIIVVERDDEDGRSVFKRLDTEDLSEWLARYSISELWEKNVLGGQP